jgi:hypothetical protein
MAVMRSPSIVNAKTTRGLPPAGRTLMRNGRWLV